MRYQYLRTYLSYLCVLGSLGACAMDQEGGDSLSSQEVQSQNVKVLPSRNNSACGSKPGPGAADTDEGQLALLCEYAACRVDEQPDSEVDDKACVVCAFTSCCEDYNTYLSPNHNLSHNLSTCVADKCNDECGGNLPSQELPDIE